MQSELPTLAGEAAPTREGTAQAAARTPAEGVNVEPRDGTGSNMLTTVDSVERAGSPRASPRSMPSQIGRHEVLRKLGSGGMGVVYEAQDPELDRRIAIKLIRPMQGGTQASRNSKGRLMREAQAMARVSHPNVITVYDVGMLDERIYIAMELVQGQTLFEWFQRSRPWKELVSVFLQAADGLIAAHDASLVHRDFKPHNVLLGDDGVVRVLDFGLARGAGDGPTLGPSSSGMSLSDTQNQAAQLDSKLTRTGAMLGTPAYMSPEQIEGRVADARSDQFSFCVSMWEGLYGVRPFRGSNMAELTLSVLQGVVQPPPPERAKLVPARIRQILERGLQPIAANRFEDMRALATALRKDPAAQARRWGLGLGLVAAVGAGTWFASRAAAGPSPAEACIAGAGEVDAAWGDEARAQLRQTFTQSGLSYAEASLTRSERLLDDYTQRWRASHRSVCEATYTQGTQSEALFERRMACLTERRERMRAVVAVLGNAELKPVAQADEMLASLPAITPCDDAEALMAAIAPPEDPQVAVTVQRVRAGLADARAWREAGRVLEARSSVDALREEAKGVDYAPLQAELVNASGVLAYELGDFAAAERDLKEAYWLATEARHDELVAESSTWLVSVVGVARAQHSAGMDWWRNAKAAYGRLRQPPPADLSRRHADLLRERGAYAQALAQLHETLGQVPDSQVGLRVQVREAMVNVLTVLAKYDEAQVELDKLRSEAQAFYGAEHPRLAPVLHAEGALRVGQGKWDAAYEAHAKAMSLEQAAFGPGHHKVALSRGQLADVRRRQERADDAVAEARQAVELAEASVGDDHPFTGKLLTTLGEALLSQGELPRARVVLRRALTIAESNYGAESLEAAHAIHRLGDVHLAQQELDEADTRFEQAARIQASVLGTQHPQLAETNMGLGAVDFYRGDYQAAAEHYFRTLEIRERTLGNDHPAIPVAIMGAAGSYDYTGNIDRAGELHAQALERFIAIHGPDYHMVATASLNLGRARERQGRFEEALQLAKEAQRVWSLDRAEDHFELAYVHTAIGRALVGMGKFEEALAPLERSLAMREAAGPDLLMREIVLANTRFALGRALWSSDRKRAKKLVEQARVAYAAGGPYAKYERGEVQRFLDAHK